jgi:hypothetical protein
VWVLERVNAVSAVQIDVHRLIWVGPLTVVTAVVAVLVAQVALLTTLRFMPPFSAGILHSMEPAVVTGFFVTCAIGVFVAVAGTADDPIRTYRRVAAVAVVASSVPNVWIAASGMAGADWSSMMALALLHFVAWGVSTPMLTRLSRADAGGPLSKDADGQRQ